LRALISIAAAAALIGAVVSSYAGDQGDPDKSCDGSTAEMVECFKAKTAQWDKRLNIAYPKALNAAQPKQREQLRKAQRAWVAYRDANCLYKDMGEGTIARIQAADCMYSMTKTRAAELEGAAGAN
jgi:uncharacterized protein YecT (DUF1311 family)